jgi:hypothetical protein
VSEQACAHTFSLSLPYTQRLTAFDLLLGVYSKAGKKGKKIERKREEENGVNAIFQM